MSQDKFHVILFNCFPHLQKNYGKDRSKFKPNKLITENFGPVVEFEPSIIEFLKIFSLLLLDWDNICIQVLSGSKQNLTENKCFLLVSKILLLK